ncbi:MAG: hypothetical protein KJO54_12485 [Gammaproteobacteria bacterium]|nr:hypothetical protein [Gammaproteobacteria bacterium]NNF61446.1 hypothetical protein [Gammaproteobacteria bacterium]NNM20179.1 hypothetical protein [Gammaproteobacteria bacterium]
MEISQITVQQLAARLPRDEVLLLDVREPWEIETAAVDGALCIPMNDVPERLDELRASRGNRDLVVMCHSGKRSAIITRFLNQSGLDGVFNLCGGITAWSNEIDASVPIY